jgi:ubiquinone/menaquinone biosynthesis C-methylase UbiE
MQSQKISSNDPEKIRNFYNTVYYKNAMPGKKILGHFKRLAAKLHIQEGQQILDVACGKGQWLQAVHRLGGITAGIDISSKAIDICRAVLPDGEFYVGSAETLSFGDNRFHVVSCLGALEHFLDPHKALKEMVRTAKDDAIFLLLVPNKGFLTRRLRLFKGTAQADVQEEWRTLEEWKQLFESAGLEVKKRWKDLHVLTWSWINANKWYHIPMRMAQAVSLIFWPLSWQYQVYHLCIKKGSC